MRGTQPLRRLLFTFCLTLAGRGFAQSSDSGETPTQSIAPAGSKAGDESISADGSQKKNTKNPQKTIKKSNSGRPATKTGAADGKSSAPADSATVPPTGSASSAKGTVKGIIDGKVRFDSKDFPDIAAGQIFVIEGKTKGDIAARLEVIQVSKNKKIAAAKIAKQNPDIQLPELLNGTVYREKDFNVRYGSTDVASLVAPDAIAGRNNLFGIYLSVGNITPPAVNLITGVSLNQSVTSIGSELEFFLPQTIAGPVLNRFGLAVSYLQSIPVTIVGKVNSSDETQSLKVTSSHMKFALLYKSRSAGGSLAEFWTSAGYEILDTKAKLEMNIGTGNTDITFNQKGPEFAVGGDFSPLPFLYLGANLFAGIPQKYAGTDSSNGASRAGSWNQIKAGIYTELRYPVGRVRSSLLSIRVNGGITSDTVDVQKNEVKAKESFIAPFFAIRAGYSAG